MKEHDWMKLYADAEKFMKKVGGTDFDIKTNIKTEKRGEALVTVDIPKRNNPIAIMRMDANEYCSRHKGFARVISFEAFSIMVDEALERMKKMLESNKAMQTLVSGEAGETVEKDM